MPQTKLFRVVASFKNYGSIQFQQADDLVETESVWKALEISKRENPDYDWESCDDLQVYAQGEAVLR